MQGRQYSDLSDKEAIKPTLSAEEARTRLHAELSLEDPFNGEIVIRNIDKPFILPDEAAIIESWQI